MLGQLNLLSLKKPTVLDPKPIPGKVLLPIVAELIKLPPSQWPSSLVQKYIEIILGKVSVDGTGCQENRLGVIIHSEFSLVWENYCANNLMLKELLDPFYVTAHIQIPMNQEQMQVYIEAVAAYPPHDQEIGPLVNVHCCPYMWAFPNSFWGHDFVGYMQRAFPELRFSFFNTTAPIGFL